jgi:hypothetical protein
LIGDRSRAIKLKGWDFTCRYERGPREYRVAAARAAKHHGNDLNRVEITEEIQGDNVRPGVRRKKINQRERFGPHIGIHCGRSFLLWVHYATTTRGNDLGFFEHVRISDREFTDDAHILGTKLLNLFKANPGLQAQGLPLRFTDGGEPVCPLDSNGRRIPGAVTYLDHTGKLFHF